MASTTFSPGTVITSTWLNDVDEKTYGFQHFGATGDGVADDTAYITTALATGPYHIDGRGLTYKISSSITSTVAHRITNATFIGTDTVATSAPLLRFTGSAGVAVALTVNANAETSSCAVSSATTFSVGQWVRMSSSATYAPGANVLKGELIRIKSKVGNILTFYTTLGLDYTTAASATCTPLTMLEQVRISGCKFICSTGQNNGNALRLTYCAGAVIEDMQSQDADYVHLWLEQCADCDVKGGRMERTGTQEGLDYGVVVGNPSYNIKVIGATFVDVRHGCTLGGLTGVSRWITFSHNHISGAMNAGIDVHAGVLEHSFLFNTVDFSTEAASTADGIISQGARCIMLGNAINGAVRHGFFYQPDAEVGVTTLSCLMKDNTGITRNSILLNPSISATLSDVTVGTGRTITVASATFISDHIGRNVTLTGDAGIGLITAVAGDGLTATFTVSTAFSTTAFGASNWYINSSPEISGIFCYAVADSYCTATISSVIIENNIGQGWAKMVAVAALGASIVRTIIQGNHNITSTKDRLIECRANDGLELSAVEVSGNVGTTLNNEGIYAFGVGAGRVKNVRVSANRIIGGAVATLRLVACDNVVIDALNQFSGGALPYSVDTGSTEVYIDRRRSAVTTVSSTSNYTVVTDDFEIILNRATNITLTLPTPAIWPDRELFIKTIQAVTVDSATSNVAPIGDSALSTPILPATDGAWARLRCNGTNWIIMSRGT